MSEQMKKCHRLTPDEINKLPGREVRSKRTRASKTYALGNGLYQAVIYPEDIHYRNAKGEWEDIDHTLVQEQGNYCDHSGDLAVQLAPGGSVTLTKGEHSLSWHIAGAESVEAIADNARSAFPRHNENRRIENKVVYADLFPGVDFVCNITPNRFKDTLIFKNQAALRPVEFILHAEGLTLGKNPSGAVVAMCDNETVFRLPAPCVVDEQGHAIPGSVYAVLTQISAADWRWVFEVDPDYAASAIYPLHLDPVVETEQTTAAMSMAYTSSKNPTTTYPATGYSTYIANNDYSLGKICTYLRFEDNALPKIDPSYYVTAATLCMRTVDGTSTTSTPVYLKEVEETWNQNTITYNSRPLVADKASEFYPAPTTSGNYLYFNIANLVRKWYNGDNNGIMLETTAGNLVMLGGAGATYHKPYVTINYVSLAGLESYLVQDSIGCGRAGTAHVGLFNGNLVFSHQETAMNGNLMPVSIARYYNSCYHDVNAFHAGMGWKFSTQQTLHKETIGGTTYYVYMDGDGTRHHFKQQSGKWKDLSGLELTMTINGNTASIVDKAGGKMNFPLPQSEFIVNNVEDYSKVTWITSVENSCGISAEFQHTKAANADSDTFAIAKDGADRDTEASMDSTQLIRSITAKGMNSVQYFYDTTKQQLTAITHPDGKVTNYDYNDKGLLSKVVNIDQSYIEITYQDGIAYRVKEIKMYDTSKQLYAIRCYEYGNCCTTVSELYPNGTDMNGNKKYVKGKPLHYHFNDAGNLVSVNDDLGYGYFSGYSDDAPANHPDYVSKLQRAVTNYLKNHHFITVNNDWTVDKMDGTGECGHNSDDFYIGGRSYCLKKTSATGAISTFQTVSLEKNRSYTFSCQFKTQNAAKAQLRLEWKDANGQIQKKESQAFSSPNRWSRTHVTCDLPSNAASSDVTVRIMAVGGTGTVWADAAQLEDGKISNRYNLLQNGTFYMNDSGRPEYWTFGVGSQNEERDGVTTEIAEGRPSELTGNAVRLYGEPGKTKIIDQTVPSMGNAGDTFVAGGWSWSNCRPRNDSLNSIYEMEILARDVDDPRTYKTVGRVQWSEEWSGWQFAAVPIVMPFRYADIYVKLIYQNNLNEVQFSNLFLHKEEFGKTYAYDDKGNVTSVTNLAALKSNAEYDSFDNLISYRQPGRSEDYVLNWGSSDSEKKQHLLRKTTSPMNIVQRTVYDTIANPSQNQHTTHGLPVENYAEATYVNNDGMTCRNFIASKTTYTDDYNYVWKSTDARGNVVTTNTDSDRGTVQSVTDPKGQTVSYEYDDLNRVTKVFTTGDDGVYRNQYVYENDLLKEVRHNTTPDSHDTEAENQADDVVYTFEYDSKKRRTGVKVGTQYLSKNEYDDTPGPKYGVLARSIYCNSDAAPQVVSYTYDDFRRLLAIQYGADSENKRYTFEYDANGQVACVTNHELNRTVRSEHDVCNRPMRITHMEGNSHIYTGEVTYDEYNNLKRFEEMVGTTRSEYVTEFSYDEENKPTLLKYNDSTSDKVTYTYDALGRMDIRTVTIGGRSYESAYKYVPGEATYTKENANDTIPTTATTGLIRAIIQPGGTFVYTYDNNSNITGVAQDGVVTTYTYDALGQLIRVNDQNDKTSGDNGTTWEYEYDCGGNITKKKRYAYTTGTLGTVLQEIAYGYDSTWKDKLTSYNGSSISYDNIGNPLSDGTWTYTWEKGRQLKRMSKSDRTVEFKYNENGLRIQKVLNPDTANEVETNYTLHGKNIVHMTQGSNELHFFYDASNKPAIVEFNGTKYAYVHNLQGDIVAILDSNGTAVVQYKYDAWGKPISKTGSMKDSLGTFNPFRYRGYVYDEETTLYYLQSRYYVPGMCRFVNTDCILGTRKLITHNVYSYCRNRAIMCIDSTGSEDQPLPSPTRPDGWNKEYLEAERRRVLSEALTAAAYAVEDSFQFAKAQQIESVGAGLIHTKKGVTIYLQTTAKYNDFYRSANSSWSNVIDLVSFEGVTKGLAHFAKKKTKNIVIPAALDIVGNAKLALELSTAVYDCYLDHYLKQDETIGVLSYVYDDYAHPAIPWTVDTIPALYGDIEWVKLGEYTGGEP